MEHKKDSDYLAEFLNDEAGGDFDNLLKEKLKGWKGQTESQIISEQHVVPTRGQKSPAESAVVGSSNTSNSNGTGEHEESKKSTAAQPAVEPKDDLIVQEAPTSAEVAEQIAIDEHHEALKSDPNYTRLVLEGKSTVQQHKIRGIKTGPWANQRAEAENLPSDEVLKRLGLPNYAALWGNARKFFVRKCGTNVDLVIEHLNRLEVAAFYQYLYKSAGREYF